MSAPADERVITLHSTWRGIVMSYAGGVLALVFTIGLLVSSGGNRVTVVLFVLALLLFVVVLLDLPIASQFTRSGVTRRAALRHQRLEWENVSRISRLRVGVVRTRRDGRGGGLVAKVGRRTYVLVDTQESRVEYDDLVRLMGEWGEALGLRESMRPPEGRSPTWLYRRQKWKPASARKTSP